MAGLDAYEARLVVAFRFESIVRMSGVLGENTRTEAEVLGELASPHATPPTGEGVGGEIPAETKIPLVR